MNLANKLTLSRFAMVPLFVALLEVDDMGFSAPWRLTGLTAALGVFVAAMITDYYDGVLARRHGYVTNFGRLMDPLADKLIVASAFVVFVGDGIVPAWMAIVILCREFLITGLRLLGTSRGRIIQADRWGKNKAALQMAAIVAALVFLIARDALEPRGLWAEIRIGGAGLDFWMRGVLWVLLYGAVVLTLVSGGLYLWRNRDLLEGELQQGAPHQGGEGE